MFLNLTLGVGDIVENSEYHVYFIDLYEMWNDYNHLSTSTKLWVRSFASVLCSVLINSHDCSIFDKPPTGPFEYSVKCMQVVSNLASLHSVHMRSFYVSYFWRWQDHSVYVVSLHSMFESLFRHSHAIKVPRCPSLVINLNFLTPALWKRLPIIEQ